MIPLADQLKEAKAELAIRRKAYPRWVSEGRMNQVQAETKTQTMEAIVSTLEKLYALEQISVEMIGEKNEET